MELEYMREYRTYFHIAQGYGIGESGCYRNIRWVEDTLVKHPDFGLPGRKKFLKSDIEYETLVIDGAEAPRERPKKEKTYTKNTNNRAKAEQKDHLYIFFERKKTRFSDQKTGENAAKRQHKIR
jgi:hypothetical protein